MVNNDNMGMVFDIQHFSVSDGPGIRTTVFLKGCPLHCEWCHNPESHSCKGQLMFYTEKCVNCGICMQFCPQKCHSMDHTVHLVDRKNCVNCGKCAENCKFGALQWIGTYLSVEKVMQEVLEDKFFYESSGGGLTLSGGEPMFQPDFSIGIARKAKEEEINVCMETSGFCNTNKYLQMLPYLDLVLFDYKLTGNEKHRKYIGVDQDLILQNLVSTDTYGKKIILRCPMIPDVNIDDEHINGIVQVTKSLTNLLEIDLEPYHNIGISKREGLGIDGKSLFRVPPSKDMLWEYANEIQAKTDIKTIVL